MAELARADLSGIRGSSVCPGPGWRRRSSSGWSRTQNEEIDCFVERERERRRDARRESEALSALPNSQAAAASGGGHERQLLREKVTHNGEFEA